MRARPVKSSSFGAALLLAAMGALAPVGGCATVADKYNQEFARYEGEPIETAVNDLGRPDKIEPDGMGGKIVSWSIVKGNAALYIRMWTDKSGKIVRWQWRQHQS